jgi:TonB family protein
MRVDAQPPVLVRGVVHDASGARVPDAKVLVLVDESQTPLDVVSNAAGAYKAIARAGDIRLRVQKAGFMVTTRAVKVTETSEQLQDLPVGRLQERVDVTGVRTSPAPPADDRPERLRIGGNVQAAMLLEKVNPLYPAEAKERGAQGSVELEAIIGADGTVRSLRNLSLPADPALIAASTDALSKWKYKPTLLNGVPIEVVTQITVNFTLAP